MLIDDEGLTLELIRHMLHELKCKEVVTYTSGIKAMQQLKKNPKAFHLIISDWQMPGMNGLEFLREFRQLEKNTPFLMLTGNSTKELVVASVKAGVTDFMAKPFTSGDLLQKVHSLLIKSFP